MQLYLWPPNVPALLSGGNRLSSQQPLDACKRANVQTCIFSIYCTCASVFPADNALVPLCFLFLNQVFSRFPQQNQAEAHYKGHKHARKLKAMEAQKNRQRRAGEASSAGRERDRDRERERERDRSKTSTSDAALPALMDTSFAEGTSRCRGREIGKGQH